MSRVSLDEDDDGFFGLDFDFFELVGSVSSSVWSVGGAKCESSAMAEGESGAASGSGWKMELVFAKGRGALLSRRSFRGVVRGSYLILGEPQWGRSLWLAERIVKDGSSITSVKGRRLAL